MDLVEILKQKLEQAIEPPKQPSLYEKLVEKLEQSTPEYIIQNRKTDVDILMEKLNKVIITNNNIDIECQ